LLISLAAVPAAWLLIRVAGRQNRWTKASYYLGSALPDVVVPLYQTLFSLLLAYLLLFLPCDLVSLRTAIAQASVELENIAGSLGRSPGQALWATILRLAAPGFAESFAGVPRNHQRTHRDVAAGPQWHAHPGDGVLKPQQRDRLCPGRALRVDQGADVAAADLGFIRTIKTCGGPMSSLELTAMAKRFGEAAVSAVDLSIPAGSRAVIVLCVGLSFQPLCI
jgi:hypothetical protein